MDAPQMEFNNRIRAIAFYLPQFYPTAENDRWWGKGFTEWTNVGKARPLFKKHYQPHLPADLGFYDLRLAETREAQAELAREHGIHGFCYYHYWFNGRRLLERPFDNVLASGKPDFPFCLCWANESWTKAWDGCGDYLIEQQYSELDDRRHMRWLVKAFDDKRYIRIDGKPLFLVYRASDLPDSLKTTTIWREEAKKSGVGEIFLAAVESNFPEERRDPTKLGFDAAVEFQPDWFNLGQPLRRGTLWDLSRKLRLSSRAYSDHDVFAYSTMVKRMLQKETPSYLRFPCVTPSWDNSARRKRKATILVGSTPELYREWLDALLRKIQARPVEQRLVFVTAWNEWAEGNHLEPDLMFGRAYLEATKQAILANQGETPGIMEETCLRAAAAKSL